MLNGYPEHNDKRATTQQIPLGIFITISFVPQDVALISLKANLSDECHLLWYTKIIVIKMPSGIW